MFYNVINVIIYNVCITSKLKTSWIIYYFDQEQYPYLTSNISSIYITRNIVSDGNGNFVCWLMINFLLFYCIHSLSHFYSNDCPLCSVVNLFDKIIQNGLKIIIICFDGLSQDQSTNSQARNKLIIFINTM